MNDKLKRLEDIKIENFVWVIYIGIIILSWYANSKEVNYLLYNDEESRQEYQNLLILIFSILFIWAFLFASLMAAVDSSTPMTFLALDAMDIPIVPMPQ